MLAALSLRDFRNFAQLDVQLPPSGLVIVGENGHGKTNLLEAAAYLSQLRSMRGAHDSECIRFGAAAFHIRGEATHAESVQRITVGYERATKRKRVTLDGVEQTRLSAALGAVPSVGFSPADVALVAGGPGERRRFLDVVLAMSSPGYLTALQQYRAALARRNAALRTAQREHSRTSARSAGSSDDRIAVWDPPLAAAGAIVVSHRMRFVSERQAHFSELTQAIGESQNVAMRYQGVPAVDTDDVTDAEVALRIALESQRTQELRRGTTLSGPHRDDVVLTLDGRELRAFGSAGQQRSAAIALRLLELETLRASHGQTPLLLLDDPFAELDLNRAARVLELLNAQVIGQVVLAVPRDEDVPAAFTRLARGTMHRGTLSMRV